jgi:hypothetical protein
VARGAGHGLATPLNAWLVAQVHAVEDGAPFLSPAELGLRAPR